MRKTINKNKIGDEIKEKEEKTFTNYPVIKCMQKF